MTLERSGKPLAWLGLAVLIVYAVWIGGPYLRSIAVRNAAVSTWLHQGTSPIDGLASDLVPINGPIGDDGRILTVTNPRADSAPVARARAALEEARTNEASHRRIVTEIEALVSARSGMTGDFSRAFKQSLDARVAGLSTEITLTELRLKVERADAARLASLYTIGSESHAAADAATGRVADLERALVDLRTRLDRARVNRVAADSGVFIAEDGTDDSTLQRSLEDARLDLDRARADLARARDAVAGAQQVLDEAVRLLGQGQSAPALGRPGARVWDRVVSAGAALRAGDPVAVWIDCRVLFVDTPVSDVELSLLRPGMPATVVFEGERRARTGTVLLMRGSAATLGAKDLVALAKGRAPGVGQVLVNLEATSDDVAACPVGRAAFVHFPDVTVLDIVRARLRW